MFCGTASLALFLACSEYFAKIKAFVHVIVLIKKECIMINVFMFIQIAIISEVLSELALLSEVMRNVLHKKRGRKR